MVNHSPTESVLDQDLTEKIRKLCQHGYQLFDDGDSKTALRRFYLAWTMLPKPQTQWEEAGWVLTALGDVYFSQKNFEQGIESLNSALHCPKAFGNPSIHLRLAKCLFEADRATEAQQQFQLVIEHGGENELTQEDPKYIASLETTLEPTST